MVRNNHSASSRRQLDKLLRPDKRIHHDIRTDKILEYAGLFAEIENVMVVVSDMADGRSHIFAGGFASCLGLEDYDRENSIWEHRLISLMPPEEQEAKYIAELRFYHFVRHLPKKSKRDYHLVSKLRIRYADGSIHDMLHRMHYVYDDDGDTVRYAICCYGPMSFQISGKSHAVNSVSGLTEELTSYDNDRILSGRERQVLGLIDSGMKSSDIAECLNISTHTVSRHRQEIIRKLQVRNTHEACRIAKSMQMI